MSILDGLRRGSEMRGGIAGPGGGPGAESGALGGGRSGASFESAMKQLQGNPAETIRAAGFQVPAEAANDPQKAVMHMIQSGQVGGPLMRLIAPMIARMGK